MGDFVPPYLRVIGLLLLFVLLPETGGAQPTVEIESVSEATPGTVVSAPVTVENLYETEILFQFVITFDHTVLNFEGLSNEINGRDFDAEERSEGELLITFFPDNLVKVSGSSATLFNLDFSFGGGSSPLSFVEDESFLEDEDGTRLSTIFENGLIKEGALPVEMVTFEGVQMEDGAVRLEWITASETNNAGFKVQHRVPEGEWESLGFKESAVPGGTTDRRQTYRFISEGFKRGEHQFRLRQIDHDGDTHESENIAVHVGMRRPLFLSPPSPNPVTGRASFSFAIKERHRATVALYNVLGERVRQLFEGTPQAEESVTVAIETRGLPSGTYFIHLQAGERTKTEQVTVVQ